MFILFRPNPKNCCSYQDKPTLPRQLTFWKWAATDPNPTATTCATFKRTTYEKYVKTGLTFEVVHLDTVLRIKSLDVFGLR
jgi:hypothetical protein